MREPEILTRSIDIATVEHEVDAVVDEVSTETTRLRVERAGIPVAAIVSIKDLKRLKQLDQERAERWRVLEAMRAPFRNVPTEEIEREAEKAVAEVRAEMRAERAAAAVAAMP